MARGLVLDIETVLDRDAVTQAGLTGPTAFLRPALHRVAALSLLHFEWSCAPWRFGQFDLQTALAHAARDEPALLLVYQRALASLGRDGVLVTFNGRSHDLPILRFRATRHWLFAPSDGMDWTPATGDHVDLMQRFSADGIARWPALIDLCSALEIPCPTALGRSSKADRATLEVKSEGDVVATFLLHCMACAQDAGDAAPVVAGWHGLADYLAPRAARAAHLMPFVTMPLAILERHGLAPAAR